MEQIQNIKQVIKIICEQKYNEFYEMRVKELLTNYEKLRDDNNPLLFSSRFTEPQKYSNSVMKLLLSIYTACEYDFNIEAFECDVPISFSETSKNKMIYMKRKVTIFWIKDFNIRICCYPDDILLNEDDKIVKYFKDNIKKVHNENDTEKFNNADFYSAGEYVKIFKLLYGDNKKSENIIDIIKSFEKKVYGIWELSANDMFEESRELFIDVATNVLTERCTLDCFSEKQKREIIDELKKLEEFDEIIKMIFTFIFTFNSIKRYDNLNFLDYTFISVELFKITELVFNRFLNIYWKDKKITDENLNNIEFSNKKLELGKMNQFYKSKDKEIVDHLKDKIHLTSKIDEILPRWISKTRNGFLHKDVLDIETLEKSITDSINILFLVVATIKK